MELKMTIKELNRLPFDVAASRLMEEGDNNITTLETLKDFIKIKIDDDGLYLAAHVLDAIRESDADFWDYDYSMGTLDRPTPLTETLDLIDYCETDIDNFYYINAHINSLKGEMDEVKIIEERKQPDNTTLYIAEYNGKTCTAIFNPFVCEYYVDDVYGVL